MKLSFNERESEEVIAFVPRIAQIALSSLHEFEIHNALRSQFARGSLSKEELTVALATLETDISTGRIRRISPDWNAIYATAEIFLDARTRQFLCRSLGILHVATAVQLSCRRFITGDERQARLAEREGLTVGQVSQST